MAADLTPAIDLIPADSPIHLQLAKIQSLFQKPAHTTSSGMLIDGQMKYTTHDLSNPDFADLEIIHLTDVQFGHRGCKVNKLIEYRDWLLSAPNRFCTFGGDMVDAAHSGTVGSPYDNLFDPQKQLFKFCEIMAPLRHRVLGFVGGNHERRALAGGLDLGGLISWGLGLPYSAGVQHINLIAGKWTRKRPFRIYLWHGRGASRTSGAIVNTMLSVVGNDEADLYLSGHLHRPFVIPSYRGRRTEGRVQAEKFYAVSGSSFLEYYGGYGEVLGFTLTGLLMPMVTITTDGHFRVTI